MLVSDLVGSTALVESLGDARAAEVFRLHDRHARDLLREHGGLEIDKTDGFLLLFERPFEAMQYAIAFHRALRELSADLGIDLSSRVGIHVGEVHLVRNSADDVARGAKPLEVEGLAKPFTARIMSLALGGQTLLTRTAFDLARRSAVGQATDEGLRWLSHGSYLLKGVEEPVEVYEVGVEGEAPLAAPQDSDKVKQVTDPSHGSGSSSARSAAAAIDLVGSSLGGFRIVDSLGAGGMGVVYEAEEEALHRTVALKVLPAELTHDERRRERFLREARSAAAVTHPCVATVYQVGQDGGRVFIAMELIQGVSLRQHLGDGPLPVDEAIQIAVEIARGMAHAHEAGVIHRDLKPDNVMLAQDGQVKLLDFGLAKQVVLKPEDAERPDAAPLTDPDVEGRMLGTPGYMSPEQCRGTAVDARSDVFSFGVVLYEALTGLRPFQGASVIDTLIATSRDPHLPLTDQVGDIPDDVVSLVDRCLAKDPSERYADCRELLEELCRIAGLPAPAQRSVDRPGPAAVQRTPRLGGSGRVAASSALSSSAQGAERSLATTAHTLGDAAPTARWRRLLLLAALVAAIVGLWLWHPWAREGSSTPVAGNTEVASPLVADDGVLACPLLETTGVEEPGGWLGAATAHLACDRATLMLGGKTARTLIPAELLALPAELVDDYPKDPYCEPGARDKSIEAARKQGSAWLDGRVALSPNGFGVQLVLRTADGKQVAATEGKARVLYQAVGAALEELASQGALPRAPRIDPLVAEWSGIGDVAVAVAFFDWGASLSNGVGVEAERARLDRHQEALGPLWPLVQFHSSRSLGTPVGNLAAPPLDTSSPSRHMLTAVSRSFVVQDVDRAALADQMAGLRRQQREPRARAALANAEAGLRYQLGETDRVRQIALSVASEAPRLTEWGTIASGFHLQHGFELAARATAAWTPTNPDAWNMLGYGEPDATEAQRVQVSRRAVELAPDLPLWNLNYTHHLLRNGQPARARTLAARLSTGGPGQQAASETILAMVECSEARFQAASKRLRGGMTKLERFGRVEMADVSLVPLAMSVASILGNESEVADAFAERFVLPEPTRLSQGHFALLLSANVCAQASRPVAQRCFARLRTLSAANWFLQGRASTTGDILDAGERYATGDLKGAVEAWRSLMAAGSTLPDYASAALEQAGEVELARQADETSLSAAPLYHGATLAHVRQARRAAASGDRERARALAKTVVAAWSSADCDVPAVGAMRELLAKVGGGDGR